MKYVDITGISTVPGTGDSIQVVIYCFSLNKWDFHMQFDYARTYFYMHEYN